jgi:colanic acid/amylovoran biosynthesis glycosyltransferase
MSLRVLHFIDFWLPHTFSCVYQTIQKLKTVEHSVAAPVMVRNEFFLEAQCLVSPLQRIPSFLPVHEWQSLFQRKILFALERKTGYYVRWLERQVADHQIDVIHAHFGPAACRVMPLAMKLQKPLIASFYGYDYLRAPHEHPAYRQKYQELFAQAAIVNCQGPYTAQVLADAGCPSGKIVPTVLGVNPERFPCQKRIKQPGELRLLQSATINLKKGYMDTLRALRIATRTCPNMQLTISGEPQNPTLVREMKVFIRENSLEKHVFWLNFVLHQNMPTLMGGDFHVYIQPSVQTSAGDIEDCPVAILEAMSSGMPVVSTTHYNIKEMVPNGLAGFLAEEHQPEVLANYLIKLYNMKNEDYQLLSGYARRHIEQHYTLDIMARGWENMYLYRVFDQK